MPRGFESHLLRQKENKLITDKKKEIIKLIIAISIIVLILLITAIIIIKYEVEGETSMPFKLSKIIVIGTVEGVEKSESDLKWDFSIYQNNDIHFYIDENTENPKNLLIKSVKIDNIKVTKQPQKGNIVSYMPNSEAGRIFVYDEQFLINDKLEYKGASQSSSTNLEIGSKGGTVLMRISNSNIGQYSSDKDKQIIHNSSLLEKIKTTTEEIKFGVSFDFTIETTKAKYKAKIELDLPTSEFGETGNCYQEITDMSNIVFKRVK